VTRAAAEAAIDVGVGITPIFRIERFNGLLKGVYALMLKRRPPGRMRVFLRHCFNSTGLKSAVELIELAKISQGGAEGLAQIRL
jgi:hypothetical protein